jgi:uncharacterized iron-regulated protein
MEKALEILKIEGYKYILFDSATENVSHEQAIECTIYNETMPCTHIKLPKNHNICTADWFINKIEQANAKRAVKYSKMFSEVPELKKLGFYNTTYGFGIFALLGRIEQEVQQVRDILTTNGIEFKNGFSEAGWVYRFIISQSKQNIERVNKLITTNK